MNFMKTASGHTRAEEWYSNLQSTGQECQTMNFDTNLYIDGPDINMAYQDAVLWHNILTDERFENATAETVFVNYIDAVLNNLTVPNSAAILKTLLRNVSPSTAERDAQDAYQSDLVCKGGAPTRISPTSDGWNRLASLIIYLTPPENISVPSPLDVSINGQNYLRWFFGVHPDHKPPLKKSVFWLTKYQALEDCFSSKNGREALSRVGLESTPGTTIYALIVNSAAIWDHLRIPTVADSEFYHMWGATQRTDDPHGWTRHTELGNNHGVPELVIRRENLAQYIDSGDVYLEDFNLSCDLLHISSEHAKKRWQDEIEPTIF